MNSLIERHSAREWREAEGSYGMSSQRMSAQPRAHQAKQRRHQEQKPPNLAKTKVPRDKSHDRKSARNPEQNRDKS
jgi:hypothetical protein